jgi:hypothetical protein
LKTHLQTLPSLERVQAKLLFISGQGVWDPIETIREPLEDLGSHQLDLLAFLFSSPIETISARWDEAGGRAAGVTMQIQLACGATAECRAGRVGSTAEWVRVEDGLAGDSRYFIHTGSERFRPAGGPVRFLMDVGDALGSRLLGRRS